MYPGTYAATSPQQPAVIMADGSETLTYAQLEDRSARLARLLYERGLRRGDNVALLSENSARYYDVYWAALRSGLYLTAVNHHLQQAEISYILNDCGAKALVVSASKAEQALAVAGETPGIESRFAFGGPVPGHEDYEAVLAASSPEPLADTRVGADMLYSSGTTGLPKAIRPPLQDRRVEEPGDPLVSVFGKMYGFGRDTVYLTPAPLYHAAPLRFGAFVQALGGTVVVLPSFDPVRALQAIAEFRITHSQWVPTMFIRMLKLPDEQRLGHDLSSHRVAIHAAAPCPVDVKRAMIDWWGPILREYYAATEGNGVTFIDSEQWLKKPGSVGQGGLGILRVCTEDGTEQPPGQIGLVYFERDKVPFTYHNDPAQTREAQHPQHPTWTTTGDIGYLDEDGYLFLTDRRAFTIISGGVNIYPQEIENVLALHPKVFDIAVIGVPDSEMGESVKAVVQPAPGAVPGPDLEAELLAFLRDRIAHYKVPRSVDFVTALPRTATGKLQKGKLRAQYTGTDSSTVISRSLYLSKVWAWLTSPDRVDTTRRTNDDPDRGRGHGFHPEHRAVPPRTAGPLLPAARLGRRSRRPGAGDLPAGLARLRRL
jgi:long-chain acyl-CoA synthetase